MKKALVRCRCGHQVLAREVLRTDLYERSMGREYVYVKFRCKRCKRMGEAFVAENRWDWSILEPAPGEMNAEERDRFLDAEEISDADVEAFHRQLESLSDLSQLSELPVGGESAAPQNMPATDAEASGADSDMGSAPHAPGSQSGGPATAGPSIGNPSINSAPGSPKNATPSNATPNTNQASQKRPPSGDEKRPRS